MNPILPALAPALAARSIARSERVRDGFVQRSINQGCEMSETPRIEGRLPLVLGAAELHALKRLGQRLECGLAELLFAVFGVALKSVALLGQLDAIDPWPHGDSVTMLDGTRHIVGYILRLPLGKLRASITPSSNLAAPPLPAAKVAFVFAGGQCGGVSSDADLPLPASRGAYSGYEVVVEARHSGRHLVIECFFLHRQVDQSLVERLLFEYRSALVRIAGAGQSPCIARSTDACCRQAGVAGH